MDPADNTGQDLEKIDAVIRVCFGIDPDGLSTDEWAKLFQQWAYVRRIEIESKQAMLEGTFSKVMYKVMGDVVKAMSGRR